MPEGPQQNAKRRPENAEQRPELRFPQFLCIGAQKAGTTWLDSNLRKHPQLWLPPFKELHYFNSVHIKQHAAWTVGHRRKHGEIALRRYLRKTAPARFDYRHIARLADIIDGTLSDHWYGRIFALAPGSAICGEVCPDYYLLPQAGIEHILRLSPDIKIILSLRDPIARSWSHIRMFMKKRGVSDASEAEKWAGNLDVLKRADYPTIIDNWLKLIPRDRLLIIFMDEIGEKPMKVLEDVCTFLNAPYKSEYFESADKSVHVGEAHEIPPHVETLLKDKLEPVYERLAEMFPDFGEKWRESHYSDSRPDAI